MNRPILQFTAYSIAFMSGVFAQPQTQPAPALPVQPGAGLGIVQAVQATINQNPLLHIQEQQVALSQGALLVQRGKFDTTIGSTVNQNRTYTPLTKAAEATAKQAGIDTSTQNTNTTTTDLTGSKLFESGISIAPSIQLIRTTDNLTNQTGLNNSQVGVQVTLPLLRNRGRDAVAAGKIAAEFEVTATSYDLSQLASQLIAGTAQAYWNYLGAVQSVAIYAESERRGLELLEGVRTLIAADMIPRSELDNAVANVAARTASRLMAEQSVVEAKQALALAIGVSSANVLEIPDPTDPYPDETTTSLISTTPAALKNYIQLALSRRADYLAAKKRVQESSALVVAARNQLKPQLDIVVSGGYAGLQETTRFDKYLSSIFQNIYGPSVVGGIQYSFPLENRVARGQLVENEATLQQLQLRIDDAGRNIASNVVTAATGLNSSVLQLQQAHQAAVSYLSALQGERERLRLGVGSILDILQTEDRYIGAALNEISAKVGYAVAIASLRLATGTYLLPDQPVQAVAKDAFYLPPS